MHFMEKKAFILRFARGVQGCVPDGVWGKAPKQEYHNPTKTIYRLSIKKYCFSMFHMLA
jgi:hypothetical protein